MFRYRTVFLTLAVGAFACLAVPAGAQEREQFESWCQNAGGDFTGDLQLSACNALLTNNYPDLNRAMVLNLRGQAHFRKQDLDSALADYNAAIAANPDLPNAYAGRADVYYARQEYAQSADSLTKLIELVPTYAEGYYWRARMRANLDDVAGTLADFTEAIRLDPELTDAFYMRGQVYQREADHARALADYAVAIRLEPTANIYQSRGDVYYDVKDYARAIADHGEAIRLAPDDAEHWNARCWDRAVWGRELDQALADCTRAIELEPVANTYDSRGMVNLKRSDWAAAEADYDTAVRQVPDDGGYLYGRGIARLRLGRPGAEADLARAVELEPDIAATYAGRGIRR